QREEHHKAVAILESQLAELATCRATATEEGQRACQVRIQMEAERRQKKYRTAIADADTRTAQHLAQWQDLYRQIEVARLRPEGQAVEAVQAARERWQRQRREDESRCALMREWVEYLESSGESLAARLPGYANLVAATPAALAADPNFGEAAACGGQFDLLV